LVSASLVANLWDVTDRDIDKLSSAVMHDLHLDADHIGASPSTMSNVQAVNRNRDECKLKYLTGAAPVVYGIPVYFGPF
jgi:separase